MTQKDLLLLVADKNMEQAIEGILSRTKSLQIQEIQYNIAIHPHHDPGCLNEAPNFLKPFLSQYRYAIVMFDHEGCGQEENTTQDLQATLLDRLNKNGWQDRVSVIILSPELEIWVWSSSPQVGMCLGWSGRDPDLRTSLQQEDFLVENEVKPKRPKEALEWALRQVGKPRSAALYKQLAESVSLKHCSDSAFVELKSVLQEWFGQ